MTDRCKSQLSKCYLIYLLNAAIGTKYLTALRKPLKRATSSLIRPKAEEHEAPSVGCPFRPFGGPPPIIFLMSKLRLKPATWSREVRPLLMTGFPGVNGI